MTRTTAALLAGALLALAGRPAMTAGAGGGGAVAPAAIVYALAGRAVVTAGTGPARDARLFDRLPAAATVETDPASRLALAFASGKRYQVGEGTRAIVQSDGLTAVRGSVRALSPVPRLPLLPPIAREDRPGPAAAAVRIRGDAIRGLYPAFGATALAGAATLRFAPVVDADTYRIEVEDSAWDSVLVTETHAAHLPVAAGILRAGKTYHWTVRTLDRRGPRAQGEASFVTLDAATARQRQELRSAVLALRESDALALLAAVDQGLGLLAEARDELRTLVRTSPGDGNARVALALLEKRLSGTDQD
jgi:hypothetical protein